MRTNANASIGNRTRKTNLETWAGILPVLLAAASLAACGPGAGAGEADAGALDTVDASAAVTGDGGARDADLPPNATCTAHTQCATGFCVDGVCCDKPCDGACESCALTGTVGVCSPINNAADDRCGSDSICDDGGACRKLTGNACSSPSECASGNCVDGVCCSAAACGSCQSCGLENGKGSCTAVPRFTDDADSDCSGDRTCDGIGQCRSKDGTACTQDAECASLHCVEGICCDDACSGPGAGAGTCRSCTHPGSVGICLEVQCKREDGATCTIDADCINGVCLTSYRDGDGDKYGGLKVTRCQLAPSRGYVAVGGDCCDSDPDSHPGVTAFSLASNACSSFDRNCDGKIERSNGSAATCGCFPPDGGPIVLAPNLVVTCTSCR